MYKFKVYPLDLIKLENRLKKFSSAEKSFFYDKEWLNACISSRSSKKNFFFVEIYLKEKILMIMFFEIKKFFFLNFLTWSFMEELNYITPIIINKHKYQAIYFKILLKEIFTFFKVDLVFLDKNPHYIDKTLNPMHLYNNKKSDKILTIDLKNTSWVKYYEGISSSKTRQTDRRKEKLLSKLGNVEIFIANTALEKEKILNFTIKNKVSYLKKKN